MPKVSIIIPVYKVEPYLEECIESMRKQTLKDIEIILVDDESPDNCPAMCDRFAAEDSRIKVIHKKNGGLGFARNSGLDVATGEYVAFTDSDDYELPETYDVLCKLADNTQSDVVYYRFLNGVNNHTGEIEQEVYEEERIRDLMLNMVANPPESLQDRNVQVSSCLGLYKREMIQKHNLRFNSERILISEDLIFNLDVLYRAKRVILTDLQFYYYRVTPNSLTHALRHERHQRNKQYYAYISQKMTDMGFGDEGILRCSRQFIGDTRSSIFIICRSSLSFLEKRKWTLEICNDDVWDKICDSYPYDRLPFKYRLFFICMFKRLFIPMWLMSKV